jgi:hypothetical protein
MFSEVDVTELVDCYSAKSTSLTMRFLELVLYIQVIKCYHLNFCTMFR